MRLDIGERLREERERLNLSQLALGEIGGVKKLAQLKYEKGDRSPDADYLNAIAKVGIDIQYVITNVRSSSTLTNEEQQLLDSYRVAPLAVKAAALAALTAGSSATASINVTGSGQRVAGRDYHEGKK
ncbi:helix-turn-helix domain-containing protein [Pectobacterium carotovorum]|uniref:helix-turn-helix domain-containing protein n=1 Tax=Pectobacterium carotovorum TaxID=554 RepID=UPI001CF16F35|nr:helix-turn-helix transcriptional regulator [Pectobacterium carotovorum]MCA6969211.1 helix-turn-helix domain-containing protein [Pectobacterium carotovorum]